MNLCGQVHSGFCSVQSYLAFPDIVKGIQDLPWGLKGQLFLPYFFVVVTSIKIVPKLSYYQSGWNDKE